jgi:hypothetical protein
VFDFSRQYWSAVQCCVSVVGVPSAPQLHTPPSAQNVAFGTQLTSLHMPALHTPTLQSALAEHVPLLEPALPAFVLPEPALPAPPNDCPPAPALLECDPEQPSAQTTIENSPRAAVTFFIEMYPRRARTYGIDRTWSKPIIN